MFPSNTVDDRPMLVVEAIRSGLKPFNNKRFFRTNRLKPIKLHLLIELTQPDSYNNSAHLQTAYKTEWNLPP